MEGGQDGGAEVAACLGEALALGLGASVRGEMKAYSNNDDVFDFLRHSGLREERRTSTMRRDGNVSVDNFG